MNYISILIKYFLFGLLFVVLPNTVLCQSIENVDMYVSGNKIVVKYDLTNCPERTNYDIKLKIKRQSGDFYFPKSITGDISGVTQGINKSIIWDVIADGIELQEKVLPVVEIEVKNWEVDPEVNNIKHKLKGGPSNALLSVVFPGLGDHFVRSNPSVKRKNWFTVPLVYSVFGATALISYKNYKNNYAKYHSATDQVNIDKYYNSANTNFLVFQASASIAASVMVIDVIHVAIMGNRNKRKYENGYTNTGSFKTNYYLTSTNTGLKLGLIHNF
jgi:hypothetical protein